MTLRSSRSSEDYQNCAFALEGIRMAAARGDWPAARTITQALGRELNAQINAEEQMLFPAFETITGLSTDFAAPLISEHGRLKTLLENLQATLEEHNTHARERVEHELLHLLVLHSAKEERLF